MKFLDRATAGRRLAKVVSERKKTFPSGQDGSGEIIVVGLPRGGVPVAFEVSKSLNCPLEIITSKKLSYPGQPEYAIGAVSSDGFVVLNPNIPQTSNWQDYVDGERTRLRKETLANEERLYRLAGRERCTKYDGKCVIIVDDGIATGMTAIAAIETARARGAAAVYLAAPVICRESFFELNEHCDGLIACEVPEVFESVGYYYVNFQQTSDNEVVEALRQKLPPAYNHEVRESSINSIG